MVFIKLDHLRVMTLSVQQFGTVYLIKSFIDSGEGTIRFLENIY